MSGSKSAKRIPANAKALHTVLIELAEVKTKLFESQLRTEALLNSLGEGLIATNERGEITTVNQYARNSLGFEEHELKGAWFPKALVAIDRYGQPVDPLSRPIFRALTTGQAVSERLYYLRKDGSSMPVSVTVSPILVHDQPVGAIEIFRDLTQEQQLDVAKEEFVSLASHQLRTPATGVMMILSMLAAGDFGPLTNQQLAYVHKAITNNNRQLQIIEDLLNAARVDAGRLELNAQQADLAEVVRTAAADHAPIIASRQQELTVTAPDQQPARFDLQKIRMVIDNLVSNASKYSPPGSAIQLTLETSRDGHQLHVKDHGVGIAAADMDQLFTKFTRLSNELSASAGGTGIGLFLAKGIAELHGGAITVESAPGRGSTFTLSLPHHTEERA